LIGEHQNIRSSPQKIEVLSPPRIVSREVRIKLWPLEGRIHMTLLLASSQLLSRQGTCT